MSQGDRSFGAPDLPPHGRASAGAHPSVLLAYYVEWHLRQKWEPLLFEDEELAWTGTDAIPSPAKASKSAIQKKKTKLNPDGLPVQSFRTLIAHMGTRCRNACVVNSDPKQTPFFQVTDPDALQAEAPTDQDVARNGKLELT